MRQSVYWLPKADAATIMDATLDAADSPNWAKRYSQSGRKVPPEHFDAWSNSILKKCTTPLSCQSVKREYNSSRRQPEIRIEQNGFRKKIAPNRGQKPSLQHHQLRFNESMERFKFHPC